MIGLHAAGTYFSPLIRATAEPRNAPRRRFIVRPWSAEKFDLPVRDCRGHVLPAGDCITIIHLATGNLFYVGRNWFATKPVDSDEWCAAAWNFLTKRRRPK